ncbi:hypothetical protein L3081_25225 [Colwellia sp. MSW7]|uniref:Uncharacterized protein n=1 Tax=Colwellia maritima TaxID=2912588 RepID=A0ABS9X7E2_9GAMM|nr:hypothetical protein [Colwellia maritima]MCI2286124.1 hypothetical protein [Colwellia maritima]
MLPNKDDTPKVISVDFDDGNDPIFTWVEQNRKELLTHLESGPKQLHWLINHFNQEQNLSEMDDIYDLFTTSFDEQKLIEDITVRVNSDSQHSLTLVNGSKILLSEVMLSIRNMI